MQNDNLKLKECERGLPPDKLAPWADIALIFLLCYLFAGSFPPDANEAHYLAKAKHYWDPQWCPRDAFLESQDAHLVFYWTFGWLTQLLPLPVVAWVGRVISWLALAWAWTRLSRSLFPQPLVASLSAALLLTLTANAHLAGEWLVGGVEAKGFAYVFVFLALEAMVRNRWRRVWVCLGIASAFHVLVGGWAVLAAACGWLALGSRRPSWKSQLWPLLLGGLISTAGLLPALQLSWGVDPELARQAYEIYVFERLPHHLVFHRFPHWFMVRHLLLLLVWLTLCRLTPCDLARPDPSQRALRGFVACAVLLAVLGALIDQSLLHQRPLAAALLRYYWFRMSDVMLPLGTSLALVGYWTGLRERRPAAAQWLLVGMLLLVTLALGTHAYQLTRSRVPWGERNRLVLDASSPQQAAEVVSAWKEVCRWIQDNTAPDDVFLTPRYQQTFKWYAGRAEIASWKDVPQDAGGILDWYQRQKDCYGPNVFYGGLPFLGENRLRALSRKYGFRYIVVDKRRAKRLLAFPQVYPNPFQTNDYFEVYVVPP